MEVTNTETTKQPKTKRDRKSAKPKTSKVTKAPGKQKSKSKKDLVLELLRRKEGATIAEIAKATDWQNHSIRGFLSGTVTRKMGLSLKSTKNEAGDRTYHIA